VPETILTIHHSILISKPRETVWDYTQNYNKRTIWDSSVLEANVLQIAPNLMVKLRLKGNTTLTYVYKLYDKPNKTTLVSKEISSPIIELIGGSWTYEERAQQTLWTQKGTIVFKNNFLLYLLLPVFKVVVNILTKKAMKNAKREIERP
jgi:hypothetical protein